MNMFEYQASVMGDRRKRTAKTKNIQLKDMLTALQLNKNTFSNCIMAPC